MKSFWIKVKKPISIIILLLLILILLITLDYFCVINLSNVLEHLISIISLVIGLLLIVWQIGEQYRNSLKAQDEGLRQKIKLDVFSELDSILLKCQNTLINTGTSVLYLPQKFGLRIFQKSRFPNSLVTPVDERANLLTDLHFTATKELTSLIFVLEKYEIMFPDNSVKRIIKIMSEDIDKSTKSFTEFFNFSGKFLPINVPEDKVPQLGKVHIPPLPNHIQLNKMKEQAKHYHKQTTQLLGYIYDVRRESQNYLLGSLFDRKLPPREPTDPETKVLNFDS